MTVTRSEVLRRPSDQGARAARRGRGPELFWPGKQEQRGRTRSAGGAEVTLEPIERVGPTTSSTGWRNLLVRGDNALAMRALSARFAGRVDLVYIDPPFATGQEFSFTPRGNGTAIATPLAAYSDSWSRGPGEYLDAMFQRLELCRTLLSERGTIFVHCDWHVSHWMRCLLDEVFGAAAFKNEIVWRYRRWPAKTNVFQRMHDVLFWYGRAQGDSHTFYPSYEPLAPSTLQTWGTKRQVADFSSGRRKPSQTDEESLGAPLSDVWDIGIIAPIARERLGYPTQKPEALLRRVIECTTSHGDLVADLFCGSGTTMAVSERLGRRWIGCDVGRIAIQTARKRLVDLGRSSPVSERSGRSSSLSKRSGRSSPVSQPNGECAFDLVTVETAERRRWVETTFGADGPAARQAYLRWALARCGAERFEGELVHGIAGEVAVHVADPGVRPTLREVAAALAEARRRRANALDVVAWDWDATLPSALDGMRGGSAVRLVGLALDAGGANATLVAVPRIVARIEAVRRGRCAVRAHLERVVLERPLRSDGRLEPQRGVRAKRAREDDAWVRSIDSWSVDWNWDGAVFENAWESHRLRRGDELVLETPVHDYSRAGRYRVAIRVIDASGNEATTVLPWTVR